MPSTGHCSSFSAGFALDREDQRMQEEQESTEALLGDPEPWQSWETQLVLWSIAIGIAGLLILGWLVNRFILS